MTGERLPFRMTAPRAAKQTRLLPLSINSNLEVLGREMSKYVKDVEAIFLTNLHNPEDMTYKS